MPDEAVSVTSPTTTGDAQRKGSDNLTQHAAAARLFASAEAVKASGPAETTPQKAADSATVEIAPEKSDKTPDAPVAEVEATSVASEDNETVNAVEDSAPTETEAEDETVPSQSTSQFTPEQQKIFDRRLGKEIGKRTELSAKLAEAEAKLAELSAKLDGATASATTPETASLASVPAIATGPQPLANYNDLAALTALQQQAKGAARWAEETLDNPRAWRTKTETDPDTGEEITVRVTPNGDKMFTEAQVKGIMRNAKVTLEDHIPMRAQFVQIRDKAHKAAIAEFPFLADKKSAEYQQAQAMLRDPWVQMRADAEWIVGMQIRGMKALEADKAAAKAASETKPKPKVPPAKPSSDQSAVSSAPAATRVPAASAARSALAAQQAKLRQKGGITAAEAAASLQNGERLRNTR